MLSWIWPVKTGKTFIDVWSIFHLSFWLYMGSNFWGFQQALHLSRDKAIVLGVFIAFLWELFERVAEKKWPLIWQSPETFLNAWISDPLTAVVGIALAWWLLDNFRV